MSFQLDDALLTSAVILPDFTQSDIEREIQSMFLANSYIQKFYNHLRAGTLTTGFTEELGDVLAEVGIEPYQWVENTEMNVKYLTDNHILFDV